LHLLRRLFLPVTAVALLLAPSPAPGQRLLYELFSRYLDSLREQAGIPGLAAAIIDREGTVWEQAFGRENIGVPIYTRTDTLFHVDGLTQVFTAVMVMQCVEQRRLLLEDRAGDFRPSTSNPERNATIRQLLTHTSGAADNLVFAYRPERLELLWWAVRSCTQNSYRETLANSLAKLAMVDSVPGPNIISLIPGRDEGIPHPTDKRRYEGVLPRLAVPYAVDQRGRTSVSQYVASTLTPWGGLISTVRDFARFDRDLKQGELVSDETLQEAWRAPLGPDGRPLPHGLGWFVQIHEGEKVVWQFGVGDGASSSLLITLPARGLTLIMLANSDRLVRPIPLAQGDLTVSPFGRLFLNLFAR
jgi:CubicO group peptidase (beta-lactamase class C family)